MSELSLILLVLSTFYVVLMIMPDFVDQAQGLSRDLAVKIGFNRAEAKNNADTGDFPHYVICQRPELN
ncbi:MAG: hypothetical protein HN731_09920 [Rhodospirillaceae bacterium]|jgi:hypothetical protein|nr:hypothetical protein [Rhodospirillaceae bacterium]MBT7955499.1 hypothetical protein [Rhodospirillaceae bacterium]